VKKRLKSSSKNFLDNFVYGVVEADWTELVYLRCFVQFWYECNECVVDLCEDVASYEKNL
jgi:hypothetical protein